MKGTILGTRYEIIEKIGEGGMAEVYKAKCHLLNRFVAVKVLKKEFAGDKEFVEKFKKEASSSAALCCNNIINIYDVGSHDNINYIVMELVRGKTLKDLIKENGRIEIGKSIDYAIQIAKALECAHKNNIIHRDIKPQNIMVNEDGIIKVADFGIAKAADYNTITNTTKVMGSAHYFSPEQAKGSFLDFRTDIYSLGIVMYEMLVGKVPYDADTAVSVALKHIQEIPKTPMELNPAIYKGLNDIVLKCMEKDVINRYVSINGLLADLYEIKENPYYQIKKTNFEGDFTRVMDAVEVEESKMQYAVMKDSLSSKKSYKNEEEEEEDDDEDYYEGRNSKKKKVGFWAIISAMVVIIGISLAVLFSMMGGGFSKGQIEVPKITDLSIEDATKKLEELGLELEVSLREDNDKPKDTVLRSNPKEGYKVKKGFKIKVIVSNGKSDLVLADLSKLTLEDAKKKLKEEGFELGEVTESEDEEVEIGKIISQNPKAGSKIKKGDKVSLVVSKGKKIKEVDMPNINGIKRDEATKILDSLGLILEVESEEENEKPVGTIIRSNPQSGVKVKEGSKVRVVISKGIQNVTLDTLEGLTLSDAKKRIEDARLVLGEVTEEESNEPKGTVIRQSPKGGKLKPGETVTLVISKGPKIDKILVPNLKDMDPEQALNELVKHKLKAGSTTQKVVDAAHVGKVISNTKVGEYVAENTVIDIVIGIAGSQGENGDYYP
ncbi:MAG: Stk1 family PASTA domain-containing Ser/Thr kinase [Clostridium sp.]